MPSWAIYGNERRMGPGPASAGAAPSATTWNPADKGTNIDLSGGNLIATGGAGAGGAAVARSTQGVTSGKWYWEVILTTEVGVTGTIFAGLEIAGASFSTEVGFAANSIGIGNNEAVWRAASSQGSAGTWVAATPNASFAWDQDNKKLWIRVQGGNWNNDVIGNQNPATNTGGYDLSAFGAGTYFAAVNINQPGDVLTGKFSSSSWTYAAPSGFSQFP